MEIEDYINIIPALSDNIQFNRLSATEFILCNTYNKHYLKINKEVYNILCLIDGKRNFTEISQQYTSLYQINIPDRFICDLLINKLASYGVLKNLDERIKPYIKPSYLKLSFIIFPKNFLSKIVHYFFPLFRKNVAFFIITTIILFTVVTVLINLDLYENFDTRTSFLSFFILQFLSVTFHEIGHASAARYFGAEHGGIGGGFYLFKPVYYADVTDIWKLKKNQRITVNLAGIYFELIFCFMMLSISLILSMYSLMVTSLFVMISAFFNLNPFMRSDGYWVLSDLTNKPNLSAHSRRKVIRLIKNTFLRKKNSYKLSDICMAIYGFVQILFLTLFIYYTLIKNPASIIYFPINVYDFVKKIMMGDLLSLYDFRKLIIPLVFYYLLFNFARSILKNINKKYRI
ncbi:MAG: hypothetical protein LBH32_08470 [Dysgonamonadaceae bacterium]|nr:hypothetical protein [Dysgonamonadaceae bacterium]